MTNTGLPVPPFGEPSSGAAAAPVGRRPWYARPWLAALGGLVLGVLLGVGGAALVMGDDEGDARTVAAVDGSPTGEDAGVGDEGGSPEEEAAAGATGTTASAGPVPDACIDVVDQAEQALDLLNEGLGALSDLETERLSDALARVDDLRERANAQVEACREAAAEQR
jgi:hypothetical protein